MRFFLGLFSAVLLLALGGVAGLLAATNYRPQFEPFLSNTIGLSTAVTLPERSIIYYRDPMGGPGISAEPKKDSMGMNYLPVHSDEIPTAAATGPDGRRIIYYKNPMGEPDISSAPRKDSMGMDYLPVYEGEQTTLQKPQALTSGEAPAAETRMIKFYRNPMGLPDTSPVPKKDSMGMDYIAVYEDEEASADPTVVKVSVDKVQRAGVRTEEVKRQDLSLPLHAPGSVQLDERKQWSITLRAEGFMEQVYAGATGQHVKAGEALFRFYSPQILQAAVEYRIAAGQGDRSGALKKLRNLGVPDNFIKSIPAKGEIPTSLDWPSPVDGVLMSKTAIVGRRVMPGDELYRLADVSTVWVIADVAESDIGRVRIGSDAKVSFKTFPGEVFAGKISFILPELRPETRTAQVRIELPNPDHRILHRMYANVEIEAGSDVPVLAIPASAIINSGKAEVVMVQLAEGKFKPVKIRTGRRSAERVEVLDGLAEGDKVVTRANFLLDAESNLQAALTSLTNLGEATP
ncbi:MAG: efflux RND transporter periplasmic adaptor subunit [Hyphomicrobiales bacterium]|nr:efflux RND transporter periplasmic adaptor subunit [Hyphomicrobiales bacterium]